MPSPARQRTRFAEAQRKERRMVDFEKCGVRVSTVTQRLAEMFMLGNSSQQGETQILTGLGHSHGHPRRKVLGDAVLPYSKSMSQEDLPMSAHSFLN